MFSQGSTQPHCGPDSQGSAGSVPQAVAGRLQHAMGVQSVQEGGLGLASEGREITSWPAHLEAESQGHTVRLHPLDHSYSAALICWQCHSCLHMILPRTGCCCLKALRLSKACNRTRALIVLVIIQPCSSSQPSNHSCTAIHSAQALQALKAS